MRPTFGLVAVVAAFSAWAEPAYLLPPPEVVSILDAVKVERPLVSPDGRWVALLSRRALGRLEELATPRRRLAGLLVDSRADADAEVQAYDEVRVFPAAAGGGRRITGLPRAAAVLEALWSPDSHSLALVVKEVAGVSVWVAGGEGWHARRISRARVNAGFDSPCQWRPGGEGLLCRLQPPDRPASPLSEPAAPAPRIEVADGKASPVRTEAGLLRTEEDERLFTQYATSRLARLDRSGRVEWLPVEGVIVRSTLSPDGRYILVKRLEPPWSHEFRYDRFASRIEVRSIDGTLVRLVAAVALENTTPIDEDAVRPGPRGVSWRADAPATLFWAEAADGGDPARAVKTRDRAYLLSAPFGGPPKLLGEFSLRMEEVYWGHGDLALVKESWWKTRRAAYWRLRPDSGGVKPQLLLSYSTEDGYVDPGAPLLRAERRGGEVLEADGKTIFFASRGASPAGERPRLERIDVTSGARHIVWQSADNAYEWPQRRLRGGLLLVRRETGRIAPHWMAEPIAGGEPRTFGEHRGPALPELETRLLRYQRGDGLPLSATLVLPKRTKAKPPLPTVLIAYPNEYLHAESAGEVKGSVHRFRAFFLGGAALYASQGYAVLDHAAMPIVSKDGRSPNDDYQAQLVADAQAALEAAVRAGIADPKRIAVVGHSYGAAMVATLLEHSSLFCAGIAMSGAYDRTLTPFGFQTEERTLWQARQAYLGLSPLLDADRIAAPLLLVHGEADANPGTQPQQSERMFEALRGLGKRARLVMLPYEDHVYRARKSVLDVAAEALGWLRDFCR